MTFVRELASRDVPEAAAIMVQRRTPWHHYGLRVSDATSILEAGIAEGARILVATEEKQILGCVWFQTKGTFYQAGYIRILAVSDGHSRRGIGTTLMDVAEREIFSSGTNIFLLVSEWNDSARAFYLGRGYREIGRLQDYVKPGNAELICWKTQAPVDLMPQP